ncbi:MAG: hypothetical protein IT373_37875 [Polyangiaceae bacterium]|nr:hypothetical protein [Polyangiaceae bacterium]
MPIPHGARSTFREAYKADFGMYPDEGVIERLALTVLDAASYALGVLSPASSRLDEVMDKRDDCVRIP